MSSKAAAVSRFAQSFFFLSENRNKVPWFFTFSTFRFQIPPLFYIFTGHPPFFQRDFQHRRASPAVSGEAAHTRTLLAHKYAQVTVAGGEKARCQREMPQPPPVHGGASSLSPLVHAVIGAGAGVVEVMLLHPLVSVKNALQEKRPINFAPRALYRGVLANASSFAPITMLQCVTVARHSLFHSDGPVLLRRFGVNRLLERRLSVDGDGASFSSVQHVAVAATAGAVSSCLSNPCELVILQQQRNCSPLTATVTQLLRTHGVTIFARGAAPCILREAIYTGGYLGTAPIVSGLLRTLPSLHDAPAAAQLIGAMASGATAAVLTQPLDTIKTRMQGDLMDVDRSYSSLARAASTLWAEGGVKALWAGLLPRGSRIICATIILSQAKRISVDALEKRQHQGSLAFL